jgi:hypothetical protein
MDTESKSVEQAAAIQSSEVAPTATDRAKAKREIFEKLVDGGRVAVAFDPRQPGVVMPLSVMQAASASVFLERGAPEFEITEDGVRQQMRWAEKPGGETSVLSGFVPWSAIWSMDGTKDQGAMFFADACPEEQVVTIFRGAMAARAEVARYRGLVEAACRVIDSGAGPTALRMWRRMVAGIKDTSPIVGR